MATILLADDDVRVLPILALHLRNEDHDVVCVATVDDGHPSCGRRASARPAPKRPGPPGTPDDAAPPEAPSNPLFRRGRGNGRMLPALT
jgi:hypothetical protein